MEGGLLGFESNRVQFVQDHASEHWSHSKTECAAFPDLVSTDLVRQQSAAGLDCRVPLPSPWQ